MRALQVDGLLIDVAAKLILLPDLRGVAPDELCVVVDGEALEAGLVDVGDIGGVGLGDGLLAQEARTFVDGELQVAGEEAEGQSVEDDADTVAIACNFAAI